MPSRPIILLGRAREIHGWFSVSMGGANWSQERRWQRKQTTFDTAHSPPAPLCHRTLAAVAWYHRYQLGTLSLSLWHTISASTGGIIVAAHLSELSSEAPHSTNGIKDTTATSTLPLLIWTGENSVKKYSSKIERKRIHGCEVNSKEMFKIDYMSKNFSVVFR